MAPLLAYPMPFAIAIVFALADISLRLVELPVRSGLVEYWFKGMKYRTKNVQRRQKSTVVASILLLILGTSYISANAISQSDKEMAIIKQQLEQPIQPSEPTATQEGGLWVTGDSVILGIRYELDARSNIAIINLLNVYYNFCTATALHLIIICCD